MRATLQVLAQEYHLIFHLLRLPIDKGQEMERSSTTLDAQAVKRALLCE